MYPTPSALSRLAQSLVLLAAAAPALAANYCVSNTPGLRSALDSAAASNAGDVISLVRGDYALDASMAVFSIKGDLVLRGGYASGCPLLGRSVDPSTTRIFGAGTLFAAITLSVNDGLEIDGLSFEHASAVRLKSAGDQNQVGKSITVRRSRFANSIMGLEVRSTHHDVRIENNVFLDSIGFAGNSSDGLAVIHTAPASGPISVDVIFNTVLGSARAVLIEGGGPFSSTPRLQNNILRSDASGFGDAAYALKLNAVQVAATNNIWGKRFLQGGGGFATDLLNVAADPELDGGLVPRAGSPALNSGTDFVFGGLPATELDGGPRAVGSRPDRGALESAISDIDIIVVTSTANSGAGTLRQAILDSNQTINAEVIEFDLGPANGCPYTISPSTPLPAVTSPLTIDGFTQPGSSPNTRFDRYDAEHCVILSRNISHGLRLRPAMNQVMTVRGLAFQRFTEAAVEVEGAGRVVIQGNSLGVTTNALLPATFAGDAISVVGTWGSLVGGTDPESANLIGDATGTGLRVGDCTSCALRNNFIGVRSDGYSDLGNGVGVRVVDGDGVITGNVIGHSATQGLRIEGAASSQTITGNFVGVSKVFLPNSPDRRPSPNVTNGIRLLGGNDHYISQNRIAHNGTDGLVVLDAVDDAHLKSNRIHDNGQLGIDLSPDGVDPQTSDLLDGGGGNGGQNYPVLLDASGSNSYGTLIGELYSSTGDFEIEAYASLGCDGSGHGEGERSIGSVEVSITATAGDGGPINDTVPFSMYVSSAIGPNLGLHGRYITATATRLGSLSGATSEFSACIEYLPGPELFRDGFED